MKKLVPLTINFRIFLRKKKNKCYVRLLFSLYGSAHFRFPNFCKKIKISLEYFAWPLKNQCKNSNINFPKIYYIAFLVSQMILAYPYKRAGNTAHAIFIYAQKY